MFYVYEHLRKDSGECFYIGKGKQGRYTSIKGRNEYWNRVVKKAGGFTAKIIASNLTEQEAFNFEILMIDGAKKAGAILSNISSGGKGSTGFRHTEKHKAAIRARMQVENPMSNPDIKKKHRDAVKIAMQRPEVRKKQKESRLGKKLSEAHRANLSKAHIGICARGGSSSAKRVKFEGKIFDCIMDLADYAGINCKTMYTRFSRNPTRWGYEVLK